MVPTCIKHMNSLLSEFTSKSLPACFKLCRRHSTHTNVFTRSAWLSTKSASRIVSPGYRLLLVLFFLFTFKVRLISFVSFKQAKCLLKSYSFGTQKGRVQTKLDNKLQMFIHKTKYCGCMLNSFFSIFFKLYCLLVRLLFNFFIFIDILQIRLFSKYLLNI